MQVDRGGDGGKEGPRSSCGWAKFCKVNVGSIMVNTWSIYGTSLFSNWYIYIYNIYIDILARIVSSCRCFLKRSYIRGILPAQNDPELFPNESGAGLHATRTSAPRLLVDGCNMLQPSFLEWKNKGPKWARGKKGSCRNPFIWGLGLCLCLGGMETDRANS